MLLQATPPHFFNLTIITLHPLSLHLEIHSKRSLTCCQHKKIENCPIISVFDHKTSIYWSIFPIKKRKTVPHTHNLRDIPFTRSTKLDHIFATHYSKLKTQNSLLKTHYSKLITQNSLLKTHYSKLITQNSLLKTHYSKL